MRHIEIMSKIYRGAWATIVALDSDDAYAGIPRVTIKPSNMVEHKQSPCSWNGQKLLTTLPTLQQQVNKSTWATRAWTYQEAILSPRCLYFTADQVYFECNSTQCCESIDESTSSYHNILEANRKQMVNSCVCHGGSQNALGKGIFRDPMAIAGQEAESSVKKHRIERYDHLLEEYSPRDMTYSTDALNAFDAVLQQLSDASFPQGFFWGLPVEILPYVLLWDHRKLPERRSQFPSWSWAGWEGKIKTASLIGSREYQPPLKAWKAQRKGNEFELKLLYTASELRWNGWMPGYDPILDATYAPEENLSIFPTHYPSSCDISHALFVNALVFQPRKLAYLTAPPISWLEPLAPFQFQGTVNDRMCIFACDDSLTRDILQRSPVELLLIDRDCYSGYGWIYEFLLISWLPYGKKGAIRRGRVRMYFNHGSNHNDNARAVFTLETIEMAFFALFWKQFDIIGRLARLL